MEQKKNITRRDSLKSLGLMTGLAFSLSASSAFLSGCKADTSSEWNSKLFSDEEMNILEKATERIIPKTDTPGANDALVHRYIEEALANVYTEEDRNVFIKGLGAFDDLSRSRYKKKFVDLDDEAMDDILSVLAEEWKSSNNPNHIFKELRDLTITGFVTSEVGAKDFLVYDPIPGPYKGCIDFSEVGGAYAL